MKISPAIKGLITAALMIAAFLLIYLLGANADPRIHYSVYLIYGLGILWAITSYRQSDAYTGKFGDTFNIGFRCFIVVTLLMVSFYAIFNFLHPEFRSDAANAVREQLVQEKKLPVEIDSQVEAYKKQYMLRLVSGAIFGYLIIGAAVAAVISLFSMRRR